MWMMNYDRHLMVLLASFNSPIRKYFLGEWGLHDSPLERWSKHKEQTIRES